MNDEQVQRPANPRRRKKTKAEIIKENYLKEAESFVPRN